ncbi:MAG: chorismate mutase, partial [Blautia sp.]|nr:chorismate mutase [Blautia sp.]
MNYQESRDYIKDAEKYGAVLGLSNIRELAGRLGNPQDALSVIHVAGTNGKGSVIAYLYQTLQLTGRKVGRYISPTLFSYRERMEINQTPVSREQFADLMTRVKKAAEEMVRDGLTHPTPFELETAAAFLFFKEEKCDLVLLEVGMGGSLDATNIVEKPFLSVLASISMDHMAYLGGTLYEIAEKKAGIIKKGCPMITIKQQPEAEKAIRAACREKQVPFREADPSEAEVITAGIEEQTFRYKGEEYTIRLGGAYQKENACLALAALEILSENGICTTVDERKKGLYQTRWKGRFTVLSREPLFIVDGAHNPAGADMLARTISQHFQGKKIYFITGMFADKDYSYVMQKMCPFAEKILTIQTPDNPRALSAKELAECARKYHPDVTAMPEIGAAVNKAYELAGKEDVILAFGSLSFISAICDAAEKRKSRPEPGEKEDTMDLQECRKRIDSIDDEIVRLFEERMKVSEEIARFKIQTGKKVMDPQREREKLEAVRKKAHGPLNELGAREVFRQIMAVSRKRQYQMLTENGIKEPVEYRFVDRLPLRDVTVVFQGVEGAYSSAAMREYFPEEIESYHVKTWRDAMEEVSQGRADYAVLPIENSTAGAVGDIYDLLMEYNLYIVGEQII